MPLSLSLSLRGALSDWLARPLHQAPLSEFQTVLSSCAPGADGWTNESCDVCWTNLIGAASDVVKNILSDKKLSGAIDTMIQNSMKDVELIPEVNFSKGCPWKEACEQGLDYTLGKGAAEGITEQVVTFLDNCAGEDLGIDFPGLLDEITPLMESLGVKMFANATAALAPSGASESSGSTSEPASMSPGSDTPSKPTTAAGSYSGLVASLGVTSVMATLALLFV